VTAAYWGKILGLGLLDALALTSCIIFGLGNEFLALSSVAIATLLLNWLAFSRRSYPFRYLIPGLLFLVAMVVCPMGYNIYISLTNYSTGHILTKLQAIQQFTQREYLPPQPRHFAFMPFLNERGELAAVVLEGEEEQLVIFPDGRWEPLEGHELVDEDADGTVDRLDTWTRMEQRDLVAHISELQALRVPFENGWLRMATFTEFRLFLPCYRYDPAQDILIDQQTGKAYRSVKGQFTSDDGETLDPGWTEYVGLQNFIRLVTTPAYRGPFFRVFLWTMEWSFFTVLFSFAFGLALAILLNDSKMKLRNFYRSLVIVPWAIPGFISILTWRYGFFHTEFGLFNRLLRSWLGVAVPWLGEPFWARFSLILVNIWLTYPYMMAVSLGALQSIPDDLYEAARVDGASPWQRFWRITLPLLMIPIAPLLIGSFATTFNNFTVLWLLTEGGPVIRIGEPAGATDILISYAYKLAFLGARGNEMALSSAVAVVIFVIIITISAISFRRTRMLEEVAYGL
jgi:maltose/maltodextrin transport system permease protein/arabinogalactan oligomer/maltooligosaccharide transport system permease protein